MLVTIRKSFIIQLRLFYIIEGNENVLLETVCMGSFSYYHVVKVSSRIVHSIFMCFCYNM
ncbi:peptidase T [Bacillus cereus]|nr:peptidase T [Bacillus nitratireducens]PDY21811.1 peptidase T [Bacillus cereus]PEA20158.1 peptidase T [Bacillus cereus]PEA24511.1 peptidase T [Bacillus cereus]PEB80009.1 peptidase T [Bacillus cereus]